MLILLIIGFYNWDKFLNRHYKQRIPEVSKFHWFQYSKNNNGIVKLRTTVSDLQNEKNSTKT